MKICNALIKFKFVRSNITCHQNINNYKNHFSLSQSSITFSQNGVLFLQPIDDGIYLLPSWNQALKNFQTHNNQKSLLGCSFPASLPILVEALSRSCEQWPSVKISRKTQDRVFFTRFLMSSLVYVSWWFGTLLSIFLLYFFILYCTVQIYFIVLYCTRTYGPFHIEYPRAWMLYSTYEMLNAVFYCILVYQLYKSLDLQKKTWVIYVL